MLKIVPISTLINTGCGLSVVSLWTGLSVSQTSEAYHSISSDRFLAVFFSACCVYPAVCASFAASTPTVHMISEIMVTPINFQICGHRTALTSIQFIDYKIWVTFNNESRVQKCRTCRIWCSVWLVHGMEWKRALFKMSLTIGAGISIPAFSRRRILWIFTLTIISDVVKIKLKFIVKWDISFRLSPLSWHLLFTR